MNIILIKLGGSIVTHKDQPLTVNQAALDKLVQEIVEFSQANPDTKLIIGHGSGSFGHHVAHSLGFREKTNDPEVFQQIREAANSLHQIVIGAFQEKLRVQSILNEDIKRIDFQQLLEQNITPLVYGNIVEVEEGEYRIRNTEKVFELIANQTSNISKIIMISDVDGVLVDGETIPTINKDNWPQIKQHIQPRLGGAKDVTGGMLNKIESALKYAEKGIQTIIINGNNPDCLSSPHGTIIK